MPDSENLRVEMRTLLAAYNQRLTDQGLEWRGAHERMRNALDRNTQAMADGFRQLTAALQSHESDDREVALRVHDIEEREKVISKRHLMITGLVSLLVGPLSVWVFHKIFG